MTDQAHSMCVSLRLDPATLHAVELEQEDKTLSAAMNVRIEKTIRSLVGCDEKEGESD